MQHLLSLPLISSSFALFCTLLALSEFAENQIFPAVARAPNILAYVYLGHWNQHAILSSHYIFPCWKVADITSYSLVLVPFPRFFYHHPSPLRPSFCALSTLFWDITANWSCSCLLTFHCFATFSAEKMYLKNLLWTNVLRVCVMLCYFGHF